MYLLFQTLKEIAAEAGVMDSEDSSDDEWAETTGKMEEEEEDDEEDVDEANAELEILKKLEGKSEGTLCCACSVNQLLYCDSDSFNTRI